MTHITHALWFWLAFVAYALLHSALALPRVRAWARRAAGPRRTEGFYRLAYNTIATLTLVPVLAALALWPVEVVWRVPAPWHWLMLAAQGVGVLGVAWALLSIDLGAFTGLAQMRAYMSGAPLPLPNEPLQTGGPYAITRHPLYTFSLLVLWPQPTMTTSLLAFVLASSCYFALGSLWEERKLRATYGSAYDAYRARVPWLTPWPRPTYR